MSEMRPGSGWKHLAGPVWEHASGVRVHSGGLVKFPDGRYLLANKWPWRNAQIGLRMLEQEVQS